MSIALSRLTLKTKRSNANLPHVSPRYLTPTPTLTLTQGQLSEAEKEFREVCCIQANSVDPSPNPDPNREAHRIEPHLVSVRTELAYVPEREGQLDEVGLGVGF